MKDCIFCKIIEGTIPAVKIWEDKDFLAILDLYPNTEGMTLVLTKKHYDSYAFKMPDKEYSSLMIAAKKVGLLLDNKLKVERTALVMEGLGVNHVHVKLYPIYNSKEGYITTQLGTKRSTEELNKIRNRILK